LNSWGKTEEKKLKETVTEQILFNQSLNREVVAGQTADADALLVFRGYG
jgi:hypothetical protein